MAYERKTEDEYQLLYDYGYGDGLELLTTEVSLADAEKTKKQYIENEGIWPVIKKVRVPKKESGRASR